MLDLVELQVLEIEFLGAEYAGLRVGGATFWCGRAIATRKKLSVDLHQTASKGRRMSALEDDLHDAETICYPVPLLDFEAVGATDVPDGGRLLSELAAVLPEVSVETLALVLGRLPIAAAASLKKTSALELPGLLRMRVGTLPATRARSGINPFTKEKMSIPAKPRRSSIHFEFFLGHELKSWLGDGVGGEAIE